MVRATMQVRITNATVADHLPSAFYAEGNTMKNAFSHGRQGHLDSSTRQIVRGRTLQGKAMLSAQAFKPVMRFGIEGIILYQVPLFTFSLRKRFPIMPNRGYRLKVGVLHQQMAIGERLSQNVLYHSLPQTVAALVDT